MTDNLEIEINLLGRLMTYPKEYYDNHSLLSEDIFKDSLNRKIYRVVADRLDKGEKVDMVIISSKVKDQLSDYRVAQCYSSNFHNYITEHMVSLLSQEEKKIRLRKLVENANRKLNNNDDLIDIIDYVETELKPITNVRGNEMPDIKEQVKRLYEDIKNRMDTEGLIGIPSGFHSIDKFTGGWQGTDLIIVGGASSMGKTSLGIGFCYNCALANIPAAIFSYEMGDTQLLQRVISIESGVNNRYIAKGTLNTEEYREVNRALGKAEGIPLYIDECSNSSLRYLINKIRQYVITKNVKFVLVDYLQLVTGSGNSREQEVASVARALKNIAKELDITVVALSQLSRGVERREGSRPTMTDLRESGEIEQAADIVMLAYRPEYYGIMDDDQGNSTVGLADLIIAKGRNIGTGVIPLKFKAECTKFSDLEDEKFIEPKIDSYGDFNDAF